jgi:hypothetical protein
VEAGVPFTLILHVQNSDPILGEVEEIPTPTDRMIILRNPRRKDGKDLHFLSENVVTVLFPVERLNFIEVLSGEDHEQIISFVRE